MRSAFLALVVALHAATLFEASEAHAQVIPSAYTYVEERQEVGLFAGFRNAAKGRLGTAPRAVSFWELDMALNSPAPFLSMASWELCMA